MAGAGGSWREPASLIATVLSRRSEATAVASTSLYTQNSVLNADSSWDLQKENWLLLLKWVITVDPERSSQYFFKFDRSITDYY